MGSYYNNGASPAELEKDSDFTVCLRCGEWAGICTCEGGPDIDDDFGDYDEGGAA